MWRVAPCRMGAISLATRRRSPTSMSRRGWRGAAASRTERNFYAATPGNSRRRERLGGDHRGAAGPYYFSSSSLPDDGGGECTDDAHGASGDDETGTVAAPSSPTTTSEPHVPEHEGFAAASLPTVTPQQAHEARVAREKQESAERAAARLRRHSDKVAADLAASEARKEGRRLRSRRTNAARAVPYLMASRRDIYERTLEELNLSAASAASDGGSAGDDGASGGGDGDEAGGVQSQYRAIFMDSVPSFARVLIDTITSESPEDRSGVINTTEEPQPLPTSNAENLLDELVDAGFAVANGGTQEDLDKDASDTTKTNAGPQLLPITNTLRLLDELADAGFADSQFTKDYRRMKWSKEQFGRYVKRVRRKHSILEERKEKLGASKRQLEIAERELEEMEKQVEELRSQSPAEAASCEEDKDENENERGSNAGVDESQAPPGTTFIPVDSIRHGVSKLLGFGPQTVAPQEVEASPSDDEGDASDIDGDDESGAPSAEIVKANRLRQLRRQQRRVEKHRKTVKQAEDAVEAMTSQIDRLKTERERYRPTLTDDQYDAAGEVVGRVLTEFCPAFAAHLHARHAQMIEQYRMLDAQTDLTKPHEWYPRARLDRRRIIFHGGPTNSGKTYSALQSLKGAGKGLYLGPLRLLAAEVYENLTSQGVYTNLFTGQEKREVPFATHSAATVEMCPLDEDFDVVVIDEIQMISDPFRGFAWTRALLGVRCKEIHVCGGMEARYLVEKIAEFCGDDFELNEYERFSTLNVADKSLADKSNQRGSYSSVRPGDCVVAFSRNDIFAIKREIEQTTAHKCCVIYGSLPPQTRSDQARRFNDPNSDYSILVASDAIGMGLNLSIKRIIFNSMFKSNGESIIQLDHSAVKQISGRAGRRNSPFPVGEVTCRDPQDMEHLRKCMSTDILPITKAGLLPTSSHFEVFAAETEKFNMGGDFHNLHRTLRQFEEMARLKGIFFLCRQTQMQLIAKRLDDLPLPLTDKYNFCMSPVNESCERSMGLLKNFAQKHAFGETSGLNHRNMMPKAAQSFEDLSRLCSTHHELELFLWLTFKFTGNMMEQQVANAFKEQTISAINEGLKRAGELGLNHCYIKRDKNLRASWAKSRDDPDSDEFHDFVHNLDEFDDTLPNFEVEEI